MQFLERIDRFLWISFRNEAFSFVLSKPDHMGVSIGGDPISVAEHQFVGVSHSIPGCKPSPCYLRVNFGHEIHMADMERLLPFCGQGGSELDCVQDIEGNGAYDSSRQMDCPRGRLYLRETRMVVDGVNWCLEGIVQAVIHRILEHAPCQFRLSFPELVRSPDWTEIVCVV